MGLVATVDAAGVRSTLMTGLADSSIGYWGHVDRAAARAAGMPKSGNGWEQDAADWLLGGNTLYVVEHADASGEDNDTRHPIGLSDVLSAIKKLSEPDSRLKHHLGDVLSGEGDATTGDVLVQLAVFGTVVYG